MYIKLNFLKKMVFLIGGATIGYLAIELFMLYLKLLDIAVTQKTMLFVYAINGMISGYITVWNIKPTYNVYDVLTIQALKRFEKTFEQKNKSKKII